MGRKPRARLRQFPAQIRLGLRRLKYSTRQRPVMGTPAACARKTLRMHPLETTQWGGRVGRYVHTRGAVGRCRDPFAGEPVEFEFAFEYEAWLQARFDSETAAITTRRTPVSIVQDGCQITALASFVVTDRQGREVYHLAIRGGNSDASRAQALRRIARRTGAMVVTRTLKDLRANLELFWRLELLRQAATIHEGEGEGFDSQIVAVAARQAGRLSQLYQQLPHVEPQLLRARLAHLHCRGRVRLDLASDDFGICLPEELRP